MKGVNRLVVAGVQAEIPTARAIKIIRVHSMFSGGGVAWRMGTILVLLDFISFRRHKTKSSHFLEVSSRGTPTT